MTASGLRGGGWSCLAIALISGCAVGLAPPTRSPPPSPAAIAYSAESARRICSEVMTRTRACADLYVPALLRLRTQLDRPSGIAARLQAEGETKLLALAREEFEQDWSEASISSHCGALVRMPPAQRSQVAAREESCLTVDNECSRFVDCNMSLLAQRWSAEN